MSTIQDIQEFEQQIYDIVEDYINELYNEEDVLAIGRRCGRLTLNADAKEAIKTGKTTELYPLKDLVREDEEGYLEPDCDKVSDIANCWLFLN